MINVSALLILLAVGGALGYAAHDALQGLRARLKRRLLRPTLLRPFHPADDEPCQ